MRLHIAALGIALAYSAAIVQARLGSSVYKETVRASPGNVGLIDVGLSILEGSHAFAETLAGVPYSLLAGCVREAASTRAEIVCDPGPTLNFVPHVVAIDRGLALSYLTRA